MTSDDAILGYARPSMRECVGCAGWLTGLVKLSSWCADAADCSRDKQVGLENR